MNKCCSDIALLSLRSKRGPAKRPERESHLPIDWARTYNLMAHLTLHRKAKACKLQLLEFTGAQKNNR
jgi:hypothetical protein